MTRSAPLTTARSSIQFPSNANSTSPSNRQQTALPSASGGVPSLATVSSTLWPMFRHFQLAASALATSEDASLDTFKKQKNPVDLSCTFIDTSVRTKSTSIALHLRYVRSLRSFQLRYQCEPTDKDSNTKIDYNGSMS